MTNQVKEKKVEIKQMRRAQDEDMGRLYFDEDLKEDGFEYRVVADKPGRIKRLERLGYEVVRDKNIKVGTGKLDEPSSLGSAVEIELGIHLGSQKGVLMRIRKEDFEARLKEKEAKVRRQTQGMAQTGIPTQYGEVILGNEKL